MATSPPLAAVLGFAYESPVTEFPVRSGPGTNFDRQPFKALKGWRDLIVLDVQPDSQNTPNDIDPSQVYQWFQLSFPNGQTGWLRGHVVGIYGDWSDWGYGVLTTPTHAYTLRRDTSKTGPRKDAQPSSTESEQAGATTTDAGAALLAAAGKLQQANANEGQTDTQPAQAGAGGEAMRREPVTTSQPTGDPTAIIKAQSSAPVRTGPSTRFDRAGYIPRHTRAKILEVQREQGGQNYRWFKLDHQGQQAWIREDLVTYEGLTDPLGLPSDLYSAPMRENYWWVRGYNKAPNKDPNIVEHDGWDLGAAEGEPMYCGPNGGLVVQSFECVKCTPDRPSTLLQGFRLGDQTVYTDPGWGYGYGHYVIVRYLNDQLPQSVREALTGRGFAGGHLFVMYAHMQARMVEAGQTLEGGAQIGTCGNTGNSEAAHLHLEVRASRSADFVRWAVIRDGLMDPVVLYKR